MWPDGIVVVFPDRQSLADMAERSEQRLVVAQSVIEAFDEAIRGKPRAKGSWSLTDQGSLSLRTL